MPKNLSKKLFIFIIAFQTVGFLFSFSPIYAAAGDLPNLKNPLDNMQIEIPGLKKLAAEHPYSCQEINGEQKCQLPWIGIYISSLYKYAIGIVGILAAVILMLGGIIWLTAGGNQTRVGEAKAWIGASLTGLIIALTSYMILYQVNPSLTQFRPIGITMVRAIEDAQKQFASQGCPTDEEKKNGFTAFITGYCKPHPMGYSVNKDNFLCNVGLNCSCPKGRSDKSTCYNSKGFTWKPCLDFDPDKIDYCNQTASGDNPGQIIGAIAADWKCFQKNSKLSIPGLSSINGGQFTVVDKGSAIQGRRIDVWVDDCNMAKDITGTYTVYAN